MFRHIIAATAVSLFATGAMAQNTIDQAGTGPGSTLDANSPTVNRLSPAELNQNQVGGSAAASTANDSLAPQDADQFLINPAAAARAADDNLAPQPADQSAADMDARWADNDRRMGDTEARLAELERTRDSNPGVTLEGTYPGSTLDANTPTVDRIQPSTN